MGKLLVGFVVVVSVLALVVELLAPTLVEDRIAAHVQERTEGAVGVSADVGTFPVVTRLLATERLPHVGVTLEEVAVQQLTFASVRLGLRGVELDRGALLSGEVRVRSVEAGELTAALDADALSSSLGLPVRVEGERLLVGPAGAEIEVPLDAVEGVLSLPGLDVAALQLLDDRFLPCATPPVIDLVEDRVVVSCSLEGVPFVLG